MTVEHRLSLEIDQEAGAAYLQFSDAMVTRSVEFGHRIVVDLDEHDIVIGIEILDLDQSVPLDELVEKFHIRTEAMAILLQALRSSTTSRHVGSPSQAVAQRVLSAQPVTRLATPA